MIAFDAMKSTEISVGCDQFSIEKKEPRRKEERSGTRDTPMMIRRGAEGWGGALAGTYCSRAPVPRERRGITAREGKQLGERSKRSSLQVPRLWSMCVSVSSVLAKAMFGCTKGCTQTFDPTRSAGVIAAHEDRSNTNNDSSDGEVGDFPDLPSQTAPKLTRHRETRQEERVASPPRLTSACPARRAPSSKTGVRRRPPGPQFLACARGDVHELSEWFATAEGDANARDSEGWPLILTASVSFAYATEQSAVAVYGLCLVAYAGCMCLLGTLMVADADHIGF